MKLKIRKRTFFAIGAITTTIVAPFALTIGANSKLYASNDYRLIVALQSPVQSLNLFKVSSQELLWNVLGTFQSTLLKGRPYSAADGGIETALSLEKANFNTIYVNVPSVDALFYNQNRKQIASTIDGYILPSVPQSTGERTLNFLTYDLADRVAISKFSNGSGMASFHIRDNAKYWNGDRVTADDFITPFKVALNRKNGVPWAWALSTQYHIHNAQQILDAQDKEHLSFEEAWEKYPLGVIATNDLPEKGLAESQYGKDYYHDQYLKGENSHSTIHYILDSSPVNILAYYSADSIMAPISSPFLKQVGLDSYGTSIDTVLGCGPYKLSYVDLDYKIIADKWSQYWDASKVISPQIELRVLANQSTQIELFRKGVLGQVSFSAQMLPQFLGDPELRKLVKPSNYGTGTADLRYNTSIARPASKWLLDADFRRALNYAVDRGRYLRATGADNSYPAEIEAPIQNMGDNTGASPYTYIVDNHDIVDQTFRPEYNQIKLIDQENHPLVTRHEELIGSRDFLKQDMTDHLMNKEIAQLYFARFKKNHPDFSSVQLDFVVIGADNQDQYQTIVQDIEETFDNVEVNLIIKPQQIWEQYLANMNNWDLKISPWSKDYFDPWTFYHLTFDKVVPISEDLEDDMLVRNRLSRNSGGPGFSNLDYIALKLQENINYFKENLYIENDVLAQLIRMITIENSEDPANQSNQDYDPDIWTQEPSIYNSFTGYAHQFDRFNNFFAGDSTQWNDILKTFVDHNSDKNKWNDSNYRYREIYPAVEKIYRDSGIATPLTHLSNKYVASRIVGQVQAPNAVENFQYQYQVTRIPKTQFTLPGEEALQAS